jgi:hypothetical protein
LIFIAASRRFVLERRFRALILYSGNGASKLQWQQEKFSGEEAGGEKGGESGVENAYQVC